MNRVTEEIKPLLRYAGAKWRVAKWIAGFIPPHTTYLEPFFGSGAIFFTKHPSRIETINDINGDVVNFFRVVRESPEELSRLIAFTPWSREEYLKSYEKTGDPLEDARRFLVRMRQAFGRRTSSKTGWTSEIQGTTRRAEYKTWGTLPREILKTAARLMRAQIENQSAFELIPRYKYPAVLIYADPPYLPSTRTGGDAYSHEMTEPDHAKLLEILDTHPGPVLLSGYENELYSTRLKHWGREAQDTYSMLATARKEVLWINPVAAGKMRGRLF